MDRVPPEIAEDIGGLVEQLGSLGFRPVGSRSAEAFNDYVIEFSSGERRFSIARDKYQYMIDGDMDELRRQGLWRAFDDRSEFEAAVLSWLRGA
jgi:hypothetical protein